MINSSTTCSNLPENINPNFSVKTLQKIKELTENKPPILKFMFDNNCPPSEGWVMILPIHLEKPGVFYPDYLRFSKYIETPVMVNTKIGIDVIYL